MSLLPDSHDCRWKKMYYEEVESNKRLMQLVNDYLILSPEEFIKKNPVCKLDPITLINAEIGEDDGHGEFRSIKDFE